MIIQESPHLFLNATNSWLDSVDNVLTHGNIVLPRGLVTKEIICLSNTFDMNHPICAHQNRNLSYRFMAAEAYWITSGSPLVEDIAPYCDHIKKYSDDGYIFNGAYGPSFLSQLEFVVNTLKNDMNTRQAVMTIWHQNPIKTKDYKCTIALMFCIRKGRINTTVIMRSNDLFLGRPYDMFNFTIMTLRVLTMLNERIEDSFIKLGILTLFANSAHIYEKDFENCYKLEEQNVIETNFVPLKAMEDWQFVVDSLLACRDDSNTKNLWRIRP